MSARFSLSPRKNIEENVLNVAKGEKSHSYERVTGAFFLIVFFYIV